LPAITGKAGAIHRVACFAGKPAPTGLRECHYAVQSMIDNTYHSVRHFDWTPLVTPQ
jgi:hypothetical protein